MDIIERLSQLVLSYRRDHYGDYPNLITIHPNMMIHLIDRNRDMVTIPVNGKNYKFMGVRLIRSFDVEEEEILIN